ncbi:vacuolar iron transporter homolog 4-like [Aristolochia californica]|uniref:vacuolar iron transporter homolog 4-like n=1 Tax=Aristolochia californica TaxID=171875 RepID=UPI0035DDB9A7
MAVEQQSNNASAPGETKLSIDLESDQLQEETDYSQRANWLRAAVLGANDGLVSTASLMMGVGAIKTDTKAMIVSGVAGLVAGSCSMAIGEFVSVYSQLDIQVAQMKRDKKMRGDEGEGEKVHLPSPTQAAAASALAFSLGAIVPLLAAAFIKHHKLRLGILAVAVTLALLLFGGVGAKLGKAPLGRSCARVLIGGWLAMLITFGVMKVFGSAGL